MRALVVLISVLVSLLVSECALQIRDARREALVRERLAALEGGPLPQFTSVFDLVQPNQRGIDAGVLYETNSFGIRGPERTLSKRPDVFRTVVIGDSFAMGSGVLYKDTYSARLERAMPKVQGRTHEVINLGISALNVQGSIDRYRRLGLPFDPDLVIYGFTLNDLESPGYMSVTECNARREAHRVAWSHIWRRARENWVWFADALWPSADSYEHEVDLNYFSNPKLWAWFERQLDDLAAINRSRGICTIVLIHTQLEMLNRFHPYLRQYAAVSAAATARELFVADSFPSFRDRRAAPLWVSAGDSHPNARGHEILVQVIVERLSTLPTYCLERPSHDESTGQ